jgi:hypothetical protein
VTGAELKLPMQIYTRAQQVDLHLYAVDVNTHKQKYYVRKSFASFENGANNTQPKKEGEIL